MEMYRMKFPGMCPLLKRPEHYNPDTLDLVNDREAREYWLGAFENLADKYTTHAIRSCPEDPDAISRAEKFKACYLKAIRKIRDERYYKDLSMRLLLSLNESCLLSQGFVDPWKKQKELENNASLEKLRDRLDQIDAIENQDEKWTELSRGLLAGNMFDWGARAISDILESDTNFGLEEALEKIQQRPWLVDTLDSWLERLNGPPHKCAMIFVDNSGVDIVLGVLPFVRQLLLRNTKVIMCANSQPALNDTTCQELNKIVKRAEEICSVFRTAIKDSNLVVMENGQNGPCLDLRTLNTDLCCSMQNELVDLMIIEGMGRALHTNLDAEFTCECLKMAVVKNSWLANRLGGPIFSVICKFEIPTIDTTPSGGVFTNMILDFV